MQMTLNIDDDVLAAAKDIARRSDKTVDQVISETARTGLRGVPLVAIRNGVPVILKGPNSRPVTMEMVNELRDEDE